jgi:hypothetical protein
MCTMISISSPVRGVGKAPDGWFPLTSATIGYDHATHSDDEHALLIDFTNYDLGPHARVAVELDLDSGRALLEQLREALAQAEASGVS